MDCLLADSKEVCSEADRSTRPDITAIRKGIMSWFLQATSNLEYPYMMFELAVSIFDRAWLHIPQSHILVKARMIACACLLIASKYEGIPTFAPVFDLKIASEICSHRIKPEHIHETELEVLKQLGWKVPNVCPSSLASQLLLHFRESTKGAKSTLKDHIIQYVNELSRLTYSASSLSTPVDASIAGIAIAISIFDLSEDKLQQREFLKFLQNLKVGESNLPALTFDTFGLVKEVRRTILEGVFSTLRAAEEGSQDLADRINSNLDLDFFEDDEICQPRRASDHLDTLDFLAEFEDNSDDCLGKRSCSTTNGSLD